VPDPVRTADLARRRLSAAFAAAPWVGTAARAERGPLRWFAGARPSPLAREALALLAAAGEQGLVAQDYGVDVLQRALAAAQQGPAPDAAAAARLDEALTAAVLRYLVDLSAGRIDPRQVHQNFRPARRAPFDAAAALDAALAAGSLAGAMQRAQPALPLYGQLRSTLAACRALAEHAAWREPLPALPPPKSRGGVAKLEPGMAWAGSALLAQRLAAWGDLDPAAAAAAGTTYEPALAEGVRRFQRRHALTEDGVLGRSTLAALQVTPAQRARQVEITMERLRWTPLLQAPRMIVVNLPEFVLRAYEVDADGRITVAARMKVIVGRAMDTRTPQFDEDLRFVEFSPYWNVPPSIARGELVPRLRRDPGHWTREGFEFVDGAGRVDTVLSPDKLDAVLAGRLRIRQRPGERNALGDIKFVFPNRQNIYLHHTPATSLFERERRDFSHGCIRVEDPVGLARFVLKDETGWTDERIRAAMAAGRSSTLRLARPLPVLIAYGTVLVIEGRPHFFADLYGHDRLLDAALRALRRPPLPQP
jgi:murein L,D-transpeptidase YcbB/YkuD